MTDLQLVSLFDGIAGFPRAFGAAGIRTVATVEIDKAAAGVAAEHFPDAAQFDDVTRVTADDLLDAGFDPVRGILTAGWPCPDLSLAGLRLGLGGARSGLVGEVFRLLLSVRPRWFVLENVPGLLSSVCPCPGGGACSTCTDEPHTVRGGSCGRAVRRGVATGVGRCMALHDGGMGTVLRRLGECGYGLAYRVLDAQHFGVPQRRRRVVIVGRLGDAAGPAEVLLEPADRAGNPAAGRSAGPNAAGRAVRRADEVVSALTANGVGGDGGADDNSAQAGHLVPMNALTSHRARNDPNGGGLIAVQAEVWQSGSNVGPMGTLRAGSGSVAGGVPFTAHALTAEGFDASEYGTGRGTPIVPADLAQVTSGENRSNPRPGDPQGTLSATGKPAVAIGFAEANGGMGVSSDRAPSVRTGTGGGRASVVTSAVRRLTPVECERLQGYPDGWTAVSAGKPQSDSARYRQLGNSIAVPVFEWAARRIVAVDEAGS